MYRVTDEYGVRSRGMLMLTKGAEVSEDLYRALVKEDPSLKGSFERARATKAAGSKADKDEKMPDMDAMAHATPDRVDAKE